MNIELKCKVVMLGYAVALLQAHLIAQGSLADDNQKHTGRVILPIAISTSSSVSSGAYYMANTIIGDDYKIPPRDWLTIRSS